MKTSLTLLVVAMAIVTSECFHLDGNYRDCNDLHCVDPVDSVRGPCPYTCPQGKLLYANNLSSNVSFKKSQAQCRPTELSCNAASFM